MTLKEVKLLPHFEYSIACTDIKATQETQHVVSCGVYRPSVKIHNLSTQAIVLERNILNEPIEIVLIDDIFKYALLTVGNVLEIHGSCGKEDAVKVPMNCRSAVCSGRELFVGGDQSTLQRYHLLRRKFESPIETGLAEVARIRCLGPALLVACSSSAVSFLDIENNNVLRVVEFEDSVLGFEALGSKCYVGDDTGRIHVLDASTHSIVYVMDSPVPASVIRGAGEFVVCGGQGSVHVWRGTEIVASVCVGSRINTIEVFGPFVFVGLEASEMKIFYVSEMGAPPAWCSFVSSEQVQ
jgi:hypothetical protein